MSKKLICLFLSVLMLLSICLTSCGEKSLEDAYADKVEAASQSAVTLSMYLMSEKPVSEATAAKIEEALNDITESKYTIHMELYFYTDAQDANGYYSKLDEAFAAYATAKANGTLLTDTTAKDSESAETTVNQYQKVEIVYPTIADYQVDLFYVGGQEKFNHYLKNGMFSKVDDQLDSSVANQQFSYMPSHYFDYIKSLNGGKSYAVANAKAIGEYTYLLLNKEALEAASRRSPGGTTTYEEYTSLTCDAVQDFLSYVNNANSGLTDSYYPLYTNLSKRELLFNNIQFLGVDENGRMSNVFSVLGGYLQKATMDDEFTYTNLYANLTNLMEDERFLNEMETLVKYEELNYYSDNATSGKEFAVGYVTGGAELALEYGDKYEMIPVGLPMLTEAEVYEDLFAVSSYTSNVSKAMQVLNLINTDDEVRNLLLYGIEGEHYQLVDSEMKDAFGEYYKLAERLNEDYVMSATRTGNTLITIPEKKDDAQAVTMIPDIKEYMVQQNLDAAVNLSSGFQPDYEIVKIMESIKTVEPFVDDLKDAQKANNGAEITAAEAALAAAQKTELDAYNKELQMIRALSEKIWAKYMECKTVEEFAAFKAWAAEEMASADYQDENGVSVIEKHVGHTTEDGKLAHWNEGKIESCKANMRCKTKHLTFACVYNAWLKEMDVVR